MAITAGLYFCDGQHCGGEPLRLSLIIVKSQKILRSNAGADGVKDMQSRNWIPVLPLAILFALQLTASHGEEAIGKAISVTPQAEGSHGGTRTLSEGADVYSRETVRAGDTGKTDLRFRDSSNLSVGPKSSVRLDKFVYDPNTSTGSVAIQATRGTFRFVAGSQGGSYQIKTPYGTLGVRG
jgi:hypothetical protein